MPAGKLETFAERARIVHIDVDPAEINKNKEVHGGMLLDALSCILGCLHIRSKPS